MMPSPPRSKPQPRKLSVLPSEKCANDSAPAISRKASSTARHGYRGKPGTANFKLSPSSFAPGDSAEVSSNLNRTTLSEKKELTNRDDPLSRLAAPFLTPASISGAQELLSPGPSLPPKSSAETENRRLLSVSTARRIISATTGFRIPPATFYRWLSDGTLQGQRFVHTWRIAPQAIAQFLATHCDTAHTQLDELPPSIREEAVRHNQAIFEALAAESAA